MTKIFMYNHPFSQAFDAKLYCRNLHQYISLLKVQETISLQLPQHHNIKYYH